MIEYASFILQAIIGVGTVFGVFFSVKIAVATLKQELQDFKDHAALRMDSHAQDIKILHRKHEQHILNWHKQK